MTAAKHRLTTHIGAGHWRRDRERLRIIEAALAKLDPSLPPEIQDQRLQPYLQQLDELSDTVGSA